MSKFSGEEILEFHFVSLLKGRQLLKKKVRPHLDPFLERFNCPKYQTGSHKVVSLEKWQKNMAVCPLHLIKFVNNTVLHTAIVL